MYGPNTWPAGTRLWLTRVPWDSEYRDIVSWDNAARNAWFDNQSGNSVVLNNASYAAVNRPIRVPMNIDDVNLYNYMRVTNTNSASHTGFTREYYYFIVGTEFLTPDVTLVHLQLDVWQTYKYDVEFTRCYVERGHVGVADYKSDIGHDEYYGNALLSLPEGLDTGAYMPIVAQSAYPMHEGGSDWVMVTSTIDLSADAGDVSNPKIVMAQGNNLEIGGDAGQIYFISVDTWRAAISQFKDKPWVAQGIISIIGIPNKLFTLISAAYTLVPSTFGVYSNNIYTVDTSYNGGPVQFDGINDVGFRNKFNLPTRYQWLKKFLTFPYCAVEVTTFTGQSMIIEPERVFSDNLVLHGTASVRPTSPRVVAWVQQYQAENAPTINVNGFTVDGGEQFNHALTIENFPRFSVASNQGMMYMASNAHSLAYQKQNATWAQTKALQGNQVSADVATAGIQQGQRQTNIDVNAMNQQRALSNDVAGANAVASGLSALGGGNVAGALGAGVNYGIGVYANDQSFAINANKARASRGNITQTGEYIRDANKSYADYAAKGDYAQTIAGINAKVQDSQLASPGVQGATGGDGLMMWLKSLGFYVRYRQITPAAMRAIGEYWLRYGYFVQNFVTPPSDLHVMSKFSYWKMQAAYVRSVFAPENVCQTYRGIFERGVTVWRSPDDIGIVDHGENVPIQGNYLNIKAPGENW